MNKKTLYRLTAAACAVLFITGFSGLAGVEYQKSKPGPALPVDHFKQRVKAVISQASQVQAETLIVGDSLTEFAYLPELCGASVLNAGISSATIQDASTWTRSLIEASKPKRVVFALGTNNAKLAESKTPVPMVMQTYAALIDEAKGHDIYVATLPAVSPERPGFDATHIKALNEGIKTLAAEKGVTLIDLDRELPMTDGVHLTSEGYAIWRTQLNAVCT
ncbi:SGNH/GDSL hydrolase family protein [Asticcacaulis machinosus]|uniref:SGNH/GDSL hydrolase family protein n=1 Tax=Asticcacaulis machinosus TaxID=2984211 RepID=A0ABT5HG14_9CAUL|nr:SGNH/GDSL hydrolase family protein [Asticcacaulis machinosus]MDC7675197.1 SGNH/GDSL hydrolase family protein [Asticcacaulis machinosus]